jgi:glycerophosphoryl diester phosphodiesterase
MVKFGRHLEAFLVENCGGNLYVVPYSEIRDGFVETDSASASLFVSEWNSCLEKAVKDFDDAMVKMWALVFGGIDNDTESRGATPDLAFRIFLSTATVEAAQELLCMLKYICETSLTNAEALRKLVKKFDKQHSEAHLSLRLLPKLYAANFTVGQPTLEDGLVMLREALQMDFDDDNDDEKDEESFWRGQQHDASVNRRREELVWLKELVKSISPNELCHLVAHRGFHNPLDRSDKRPLENSLAAYEAAWTNGIYLCECDVTLTKDEKLVLAHDDDFSRLALDTDAAHTKVRDLTFRELISLPLKSGIRPPLLIDVLRSARAIGGNSKLIIEIKAGNNDAAKALARLFIRHPDLMEQCAVIMSFDAFCMHTLRQDLAVFDPGIAAIRKSHRSRMSLGSMSMLCIDPQGEDFLPLSHRDSFDHYGVGLSISSRSVSSFRADLLGSSPNPRNVSVLSSSPKRTSDMLGSSPNLRKGMPPSSGALGKLHEEKRIPQLMLLTVCEAPKASSKVKKLQVSIDDLTPMDQWLHRPDGSLDGVYLQFQKEMLTREGTHALQELASKCAVGVWGHAHKDPDDYETFHHLVRVGKVSFVNSDLPKAFKKKAHLLQRRGMTFGA